MAGVFFPLWFGVPVMVVLGAWGLGVAVRRAEVAVDPVRGVLVFRVGLLARRVRLASVTAVQADGAKVSVARSDGGEISVYAWRKSPLDRWLRIPVVAGDVAHAISGAASAARGPGMRETGGVTAAEHPPAAAARSGRMPIRSRRPLAVALLGCTGLLAIVAAFLVRVSWPDPVLTALGAVLALVLGVSGLFYLLFALWLLVTGRAARRAAGAVLEVEPGRPHRLNYLSVVTTFHIFLSLLTTLASDLSELSHESDRKMVRRCRAALARGLHQEDLVVRDRDRAGGERCGGGAGDDRAVGDLEFAAVTRAVDRAVRDLVADAADVGADSAEGLEHSLGRLGDDDLLVEEDHAAAHRDVAHHAEQGARRGAAAHAGGLARRGRGRRRRRGLLAGGHAGLVGFVRDGGGAASGQHTADPDYPHSQ
jgi:hypothetical protein